MRPRVDETRNLPRHAHAAEGQALVQTLEGSTADRYVRNGEKPRRFKSFSYAARSWSKERRVIARVEVSSMGRDTRFIVTNLMGPRGKHLYEKI
ncbi:transposase, IS4 [Roseobacter sp. AzwK-3b]|nr:transposase, IS4 [Roseobacter sp. AzwK-3b]